MPSRDYTLNPAAKRGTRQPNNEAVVSSRAVESGIPEAAGTVMYAMVRKGRWQDRYPEMPVDPYGKTLLIVGFGKMAPRPAKRLGAMEMNVLVRDPYMYSETIRGTGFDRVGDPDEVVARADFTSPSEMAIAAGGDRDRPTVAIDKSDTCAGLGAPDHRKRQP